MSNQALEEIAAERQRQISGEGWTPEHDDTQKMGELARAASVYAFCAADAVSPEVARSQGASFLPPFDWPWSPEWFKPTNRRRDLVKAGALIVAEIERLDRLAAKAGDGANEI